MTDPSTESFADVSPEKSPILDLALEASHYYIKSSSIVEKIEHDGRTFYSKFRRIDTPPNPILVAQHLRREITMALPLLENGFGDKIIVDYFGDEPEQFLRTLEHLLRHLEIEGYRIFRGKRGNKRTVMIPLPFQSLEALHRQGAELSDMLQTRLLKAWKILPDMRLPERYNIYTLPYGYIN